MSLVEDHEGQEVHRVCVQWGNFITATNPGIRPHLAGEVKA